MLCQRRRVLVVGITTTTTVSTCRRPGLLSRMLAEYAANSWVEIWPASATKQNMILSNVSRKSSRFYMLYVNIIMQRRTGRVVVYLTFELVGLKVTLCLV